MSSRERQQSPMQQASSPPVEQKKDRSMSAASQKSQTSMKSDQKKTQLYIGQLSRNVYRDDLKKEFTKFGQI